MPSIPPQTTDSPSDHVLDTTARPVACSCGGAKYAGSPTFVRTRHALHLKDVAARTTDGQATD